MMNMGTGVVCPNVLDGGSGLRRNALELASLWSECCTISWEGVVETEPAVSSPLCPVVASNAIVVCIQRCLAAGKVSRSLPVVFTVAAGSITTGVDGNALGVVVISIYSQIPCSGRVSVVVCIAAASNATLIVSYGAVVWLVMRWVPMQCDGLLSAQLPSRVRLLTVGNPPCSPMVQISYANQQQQVQQPRVCLSLRIVLTIVWQLGLHSNQKAELQPHVLLPSL